MPFPYDLGWGCYRVYNISNETWFDAQQQCLGEWTTLLDQTAPNSTHLIALEHREEYNALVHLLIGKLWINNIS